MGISTHVLDTSRGKPASGLTVTLDRTTWPGAWERLERGITDADGRCPNLLGVRALEAGTYRLTFLTGDYFRSLGVAGLYPEVVLSFLVRDPDEHYHIPLLLGPHTYTTYRGS
jgi:5-hydroxyisourate hydrolase